MPSCLGLLISSQQQIPLATSCRQASKLTWGCAGFDTQAWYSALFDFELGAAANGANGASADTDLVPQLVAQVGLGFRVS